MLRSQGRGGALMEQADLWHIVCAAIQQPVRPHR
jgi:hypothetical protein